MSTGPRPGGHDSGRQFAQPGIPARHSPPWGGALAGRGVAAPPMPTTAGREVEVLAFAKPRAVRIRCAKRVCRASTQL